MRLTLSAASIVLLMVIIPEMALAVVYDCTVTGKIEAVTPMHIYTASDFKKYRYRLLIEETANGATLSRCSFSSLAQKDTCDTYDVDRIEYDENVKIKKYYVFRSHFDAQFFRNLTFVENNGRGVR